MNKKGADKLISVYWFVILFIVAAGIVYMAFLFYGEPFDVREIEADLLIEKVANCLVRGGELVESWDEMNLEKCGINFEVEDSFEWKEKGQFYLKVEKSNFEENNFELIFDGGNSDLVLDCGKGKNFPVCVERSFYAIDGNNKYEIKVLGIVRKTEKNVL